eukprot:76383-Amphidinium_carterae.1
MGHSPLQGHLAEYVQPYPITSPESEGLARLYPAARPRKPVAGHKRPYRWVREIGQLDRNDARFFGLIYAKESGRYPFSNVHRLPDIVPGDSRSIKERDRMERRALYETLDLPNPDDYPWPGSDVKDDPQWENEDPTKGPTNWWSWDFHCCVQAEFRCLTVPEREKMKHYVCYICKKPGTWVTDPDQIDMYKCLICDDVYMCKEHSIFLKSLDCAARVCCRH